MHTIVDACVAEQVPSWKSVATFVLFAVTSRLPLSQVHDVTALEQLEVKLFVHTILGIVFLAAPCAEALKQQYVLSCMLAVWQMSYPAQSEELRAVAAKFARKLQLSRITNVAGTPMR